MGGWMGVQWSCKRETGADREDYWRTTEQTVPSGTPRLEAHREYLPVGCVWRMGLQRGMLGATGRCLGFLTENRASE